MHFHNKVLFETTFMNIPEKSAKDGGKSTDFKKLNSTLEPVCYDLQETL